MLSYVNNGFDTEVKPLSKQELDAILNSDYQQQLVRRIRLEHDRDRRSALKVKLRAVIPMGYPDIPEYQRYQQAYRQLLSGLPAADQPAWQKKNKLYGLRKIEFFRPSHFFMIDVDHQQEKPQDIFQRVCAALSAHGLEVKGLIAWAYVTASGDGLRLIVKGRPGSDIVKDQEWLAQLCGLTIDAACKDVTRLSFVTTAADTLYRDDELLFGLQEPCYENPNFGGDRLLPKQQELFTKTEKSQSYSSSQQTESSSQQTESSSQQTEGTSLEIEKYSQQTESSSQQTEGSSQQTEGTSLEIEKSSQQKESSSLKSEGSSQQKEFPKQYHGFSFEEILKTYWLLNNHGHEPAHGDRDTLTYQLACDLRHICDNDFDLLRAVIPCYDNFPPAKKEEKIRNALSSSYNAMPGRMTRVLEYLENQRRTQQQSADAELKEAMREEKEVKCPPEMPKKLPRLMELLLSCTPDIYRPAVAHAVFPSLAAHLHVTKFRYIDNVLHEATLMNVLMAGTGAGKDCISGPINHIMADIRERDAVNLKREREWKNETSSKGANKDKKLRPEGLVIQEIDADMTNPAFVLRTAEAQGHILYTKMNEIEQFDALRGGSGQQFQIMCLAFDPDNRYGQTRVGAQSITEKVQVRFNWNASTTIQKGKQYFRRVLTNGPISRINFCTIPEREIGAPMPVYGSYSQEFDEELKGYIERLCQASGIVDCPDATRLAHQLCDEAADQARLTQNRVFENLSFRGLVIAWLKACVLYVANGCQWEPEMDDFIRWSFQYDLWCKMEFFGDDIMMLNEQDSALPARRTNRRNLLVLLNDRFTLADAQMLRQKRGLDPQGTDNMINQWVFRKFIMRVGTDVFQKI